MSAVGGPNVVDDGLVLALDAANKKGISPAANEVYNGYSQFIRNLVNKSDTISAMNGVRLGNVQYYTTFAIDYPEGNYGGAAASRHGITSGFNVTSGDKFFQFGRALNYAVWNNDTNTWVKTSIYDSYLGTAAVDTFVSEYNSTIITYPNATHIVAGSHRDSHHTTAQYTILRDLGAPSNVDSIINFSSPEWILVGEPGLGAGNAYVWSFQNYSTNPDQVAHAVFPLPINKDNSNNYLEFDGSNDHVFMTGFPTANFMTLSCWFKTSTQQVNKYVLAFAKHIVNGSNGFDLTFQNTQIGSYVSVTGTNSGGNLYTTNYYDGVWHNLVTTYDGSAARTYYDGNLVVSRTGMSGNLDIEATKRLNIGSWANNNSNASCNLSDVKIYNRALTAAEILQNYNATKSRFGL